MKIENLKMNISEQSLEQMLDILDSIGERISKLKTIVLKAIHGIDDSIPSREEAVMEYTDFRSKDEKLDSESNSGVPSDESLSENSNEISDEDPGSDSYEPDAHDQLTDQSYSSYSE